MHASGECGKNCTNPDSPDGSAWRLLGVPNSRASSATYASRSSPITLGAAGESRTSRFSLHKFLNFIQKQRYKSTRKLTHLGNPGLKHFRRPEPAVGVAPLIQLVSSKHDGGVTTRNSSGDLPKNTAVRHVHMAGLSQRLPRPGAETPRRRAAKIAHDRLRGVGRAKSVTFTTWSRLGCLAERLFLNGLRAAWAYCPLNSSEWAYSPLDTSLNLRPNLPTFKEYCQSGCEKVEHPAQCRAAVFRAVSRLYNYR